MLAEHKTNLIYNLEAAYSHAIYYDYRYNGHKKESFDYSETLIFRRSIACENGQHCLKVKLALL
jgi:hypothetical protein